MKTQNGFTLMNKNEISSYLAKQKMVALGLNVNQATMLTKNIWNLLDTHRR